MPLGPFGHPCFCPVNNGMTNYAWVGAWASICAYNWRDFVAIIFGLINIGLWVTLSLPQYRKIIRMKSAAGLSISMLLFWTIADVLGLIGLKMSGETGTLIWLTVFFTFNNCIGVGIWFFYAKIYPRYFVNNPEGHDGYVSLDDDNDQSKGLLSGSNDDSDDEQHGEVLILGSRKRSSVVPTPKAAEEKKQNLLADDDLLDVPISLIGVENSINAQGANGGSGHFAPAPGSYALSLRNPLSPHSFALIVCIIAIAALPQIDAKHIQRVGEITREVVTTTLNAVLGQDELAPCVPLHRPSTLYRIIGFTLTVICAVMNSVSRIPQVLLNRKRKTTAGLSLSFILFQLSANVAFFLSRFMPTTLNFSMQWFETSFPWVASATVSTLFLLVIWHDVYWFGNAASILPRRHFKYARSLTDRLIFRLPARKDGQEDDGYDAFFLAEENFAKDPEAFFRVASQLQAKNMYSNLGDLDIVNTKGTSGQGHEEGEEEDFYGEMDDFDPNFVSEKDIQAVEQSAFHNPMFGITTDLEADNPMYTMVVQSTSFLRTGSFSRTPSSMALPRTNSRFPRTSSRFTPGMASGKSFARTKSTFNPNQDLP